MEQQHIQNKTGNIEGCVSAILVELDYKGTYQRYALTPEEFQTEFPEVAQSPVWPLTESASDTLRPMVHIWFSPVIVGNDEWDEFFTDMTVGLPVSDIESGNYAEICPELAQSFALQLQALRAAMED